MRVIPFRPADWYPLRMLAEHLFDRHRFGAVIQLRRAGVRVDIIDLLRRKPCVVERFAHGAHARFAARQGRSHVESIVIETVTEHFRVDARAARSRVLKLFYNERGAAFSHDKAIAQQVERTTSQSGIPRPSAHRFDDVECPDRNGRKRRFGSSGDDHIGEIVANVAQRFAHGYRAAGATVRVGRAYTAKTEVNRNVRMG